MLNIRMRRDWFQIAFGIIYVVKRVQGVYTQGANRRNPMILSFLVFLQARYDLAMSNNEILVGKTEPVSLFSFYH